MKKEKKNQIENIRTIPVGEKIKRRVHVIFKIAYIENSGFGAFSVEDLDTSEVYSISGTFPIVPEVNRDYEILGTVSEFRGEKQLKAESINILVPVGEQAIVLYLQTLKGLKSKAEKIYEIFGEDSLKILAEDPMKVANAVAGIGKKSALKWQAQIIKETESQKIVMELLGYGLTPNEAKKIYDKYQRKTLEIVLENPYIMAQEIKGFGFEKCDIIARKIGFDPKSSYRIKEGIMHVLELAMSSGHCYLPINVLLKEAQLILDIRLTALEMFELSKKYKGQESFVYEFAQSRYDINYIDIINSLRLHSNAKNERDRKIARLRILAFNEDSIASEIETLILEGRLIQDGEKIYDKTVYQDEQNVARYVKEIIESDVDIPNIDIRRELDYYCYTNNIELEKMQKKAVISFSKTKGGFHILNGSAGCGKTFTLNIILELLKIVFKTAGEEVNVLALAPTGKAAKVASKATGLDCKTVHRGLGYTPGQGFAFNEWNKLEHNIIVVDESSMLDISLAKNLLSAIKQGAKVIFLGDTKQLPSVGAGNVLLDLISSKAVDIVTLDVVKRQGKQSGIIKNANHIINKEMIETQALTGDAFIIQRETPESTAEAILESIKRIQTNKGWSLEDIQVLCPQKSTLIGTEYMNYLLQQEFNPGNNDIVVSNKKVKINKNKRTEILCLNFKVGDKVIHIKNNYDINWLMPKGGTFVPTGVAGITNGECGVISDIKIERNSEGDREARILVKYDNGYIEYQNDFSELDHAYALTIHKSQGSQWKAVIVPIMYQNYVMLDNNLFYTAYTRAESFSVVVGEDRAIKHAINTQKARKRYTSLAERLQ